MPDTALAPELIEQIERDLLTHIMDNIEADRLHAEDAAKLSEEFLTLLPFHDKKDLLEKLNTLGKKYTEAQAVYLSVAAPHEEEERKRKLTEMATHIKAGNIEHAITVAKGGTVV